MGIVYKSETLDVYSIDITDIDEDRIHLSIKYYDVADKISDTARVLIDRKNDVIWINDERDCYEELREVIKKTIVIQEGSEFVKDLAHSVVFRKELEVLLAYYYQYCKPEETHASKKFPNLFIFFELTKEK